MKLMGIRFSVFLKFSPSSPSSPLLLTHIQAKYISNGSSFGMAAGDNISRETQKENDGIFDGIGKWVAVKPFL